MYTVCCHASLITSSQRQDAKLAEHSHFFVTFQFQVVSSPFNGKSTHLL